MSDSAVLAMPMTVMSSVTFTFTSLPSRVLMLSVLPSTLSMVPRMRVVIGGCCAEALDARTETTASEARSERGSHEKTFGMICPSRVWVGANRREHPVTAGLFRTDRRPGPSRSYAEYRRPLHRRRQPVAADADTIGLERSIRQLLD